MPKGHFFRTEEHRKAISDALKGIKRSDETKQRVSKSKKGVSIWSEEDRRRMSEERRGENSPRFGKLYDDDYKKRMSDARQGVSWGLKRHGISVEQYTEQIAAGNKWCSQGKHWSPRNNFSGTRTYCIDCRSALHRKALLHRKYGVTEEWFKSTLAEQGGGCAICGQTKPAPGKFFLSIDHCHTSGDNRGILCARCNLFIGQIESAGILPAAMAYLVLHASPSVQNLEIKKRD